MFFDSSCMTGQRESGTHRNIGQFRQRDTHVPVLLTEAIDGLALKRGSTVVDATLGSGGHFAAILQKLGARGTLLGIDVDPIAVASTKERYEEKKSSRSPQLFFATGNFREIIALAKTHGITKADAILADLGWRMEQFGGDPEKGGNKGFSFTADEPLLMTFGNPASYQFIAADVVNTWREEDIATVLRGYGEERYARKIARAIFDRREKKPIETSAELAEIIGRAVPAQYRHGRIHPATKTFQALRIVVNDELDALKEFIKDAATLLSLKGRLAIISFHSIEDRIVKRAIRMLEQGGHFRRVVKKPITPTDEAIQRNPRARSAILRIIEKQ